MQELPFMLNLLCSHPSSSLRKLRDLLNRYGFLCPVPYNHYEKNFFFVDGCFPRMVNLWWTQIGPMGNQMEMETVFRFFHDSVLLFSFLSLFPIPPGANGITRIVIGNVHFFAKSHFQNLLQVNTLL